MNRILPKPSELSSTKEKEVRNAFIKNEVIPNDILEHISEAYLVLDLTGNIIQINEKASNLFKHAIKDSKLFIKKCICDNTFPDFIKLYRALLRNGHLLGQKICIQSYNQPKLEILIRATVLYDANQKPIAFQCLFNDQVDRESFLQNYHEQKEQLVTVLENSSLGIVFIKNGKILKTNTTFCSLLGYDEHELSTLTINDISFPEDVENSQKIIQKMNLGKINHFHFTQKYKKKDQSLLIARVRINIIKDEIGNYLYHVAMLEDITKEVQESSMLKALNTLMSSIIGKSNIYEIAWEITQKVISLFGLEDCVIYMFNHDRTLLEQIAAYGDKNPKGREIINKITIPLGEGIVGTVAQTGISEIVNDTALDSRYIVDDKYRASEITVPIIADGMVIGIIDSEHSTKNYFTNTHLETLTNIANLAASQLKSAMNLQRFLDTEKQKSLLLNNLQARNQELQEYAHIVSHDLKSPLRSINALISWLKEDYTDVFEQQKTNHIPLIENTLDRMEKLINGVLDYSKIDLENNEYKSIDLNQVIHNIKKTTYIPKHINILIKKPLPILKIDHTKATQLFQNLISNAIKFIDKNIGIIQIDYEDHGTYHTFSVKDNGIGIDKKYHQKIFKMFQSLQTNAESTGIGLAIVKKIVQYYNGDIWLESTVGKGTTFFFNLKKVS
ncbi:PAS domain-containing sensor histidine kinase [Aquimarina rhabdastrellae]